MSSSSLSKLSCWVSDSLRSFLSHEFGWRPLQAFKVPQLSGSFGGESFGLVPSSEDPLEVRAEVMVKGVDGTEVESDPDGRCVLVG